MPADWRNNQLVLNLSEKRVVVARKTRSSTTSSCRCVRGDETVDRVDSYFGLREVTIRGAAILINGKPVFQRMVLDQGFYPDGIWTAPSDEALRRDIELSKAVGFNGARLHQKVFEPRFLYWADKLGYLVWGEFPNWGLNYSEPGRQPAGDQRVDRDRAPRPQPSRRHRLVPVQRDAARGRPAPGRRGQRHPGDRPHAPGHRVQRLLPRHPEPGRLDAHDYDQNPASFRQRWTEFVRAGQFAARALPGGPRRVAGDAVLRQRVRRDRVEHLPAAGATAMLPRTSRPSTPATRA